MTSLTQINRRKRCVNILCSEKGARKHTGKYKCGLLVRAKRLHTPGETTLSPGKMTPGEQDISRNDCNSSGLNGV